MYLYYLHRASIISLDEQDTKTGTPDEEGDDVASEENDQRDIKGSNNPLNVRVDSAGRNGRFSDVDEGSDVSVVDGARDDNSVCDEKGGSSLDDGMDDTIQGAEAIASCGGAAGGAMPRFYSAAMVNFRMPSQPPTIEKKLRAGADLKMVERSIFLQTIYDAVIKTTGTW